MRGVLPLVLVCLLTSACLGAPAHKPAPTPIPIAQLDTSTMVIPRMSFCDLIPVKAVEAAIAGTVEQKQEWGNGGEAPVSGSQNDVTHEFGCSWANADGVTTRAWLFARPLTRAFAQRVARQTSTKEDCLTPPGPQFGDPSQLQVCQLGGGVLRVRHSGLFGDSWLSCEVAAPAAEPAELRARAGAWCVAVATTLAAIRS